jgi:ubiquinol-cytochrome c reductase iron-sulfur subunit
VKHSPVRRDFLTTAGLAMAGVGAASALWPLFRQGSPNPATISPPSLKVDLAAIAPGHAALVQWNGKPVFVLHRTPEEIALCRAVTADQLVDALARNPPVAASAPATDANRTSALHPQWVVVVGICTHDACVLRVSDDGNRRAPDDGWFCPCNGTRYDLAGRLRSGPGSMNLPVPPHSFEGARWLLIG